MAESMDIDELLKLLQNADPKQLAHLAKEMGKPVKQEHKVSKKEVFEYTSVTRSNTCLLCGTNTTSNYKLRKGEELTCINPSGVANILTITGKSGNLTVPSTSSRCCYCASVISKWDREQLERRFLLLLENCSFKEVVNYSKAIEE